MLMLFFADVSIFARPPFKTRKSHLNDIDFILSFAVFGYIRNFEGSERVFSVPGSKTKAKNLKLIWEIPQKY